MKSPIETLFDQGHYRELVEAWEKEETKSIQDGTLVVGALCFLGRRWEAEELPAELVNPFGRNFFLSLALVRESRYGEARKLIDENMLLLKKSSGDWSRFFSWQGQGFFQFFTGETSELLESAERSYRAALRLKFIRGQMMALDLLAHGYFFSGRVHEAIDTFDRAIALARRTKADGLITGYEVSKLCYQSQISPDPEAAMHELERLSGRLTAQDTYSVSVLGIEILRQLIHAGRLQEAASTFARISPGIYRSKNRRQIATMLHRYAFLLFAQGSSMEALTVLQSARLNLIEEVDRLHLLRSYGLEERISLELQPGVAPPQELGRLQKLVPNFLGKRIHARSQRATRTVLLKGQDPLGDLLDQAAESPESALPSLARHGLWGLIPLVMGWPARSGRVVLDVEGERALVVHQPGHCYLTERPLKGLPRKILELLREGKPMTRAQLVQGAWGYRYDPLRHDPVLNSTLHQLRSILGEGLELVQAGVDGYRLRLPVFDYKKMGATSEKAVEIAAILAPSYSLPSELSHLNARQIRLIRHWEAGATIDIRTYCRDFQVSHMTAFRDLTQLTQEKFFHRLGKGRATCYLRI